MRIATHEDLLHAAITVESQARWRSPTSAIASGPGQDPRSAARHPDRPERQHSHHRHAERPAARWRSRSVMPPHEATLTKKPARRWRHHHREDRHDRARQLGSRRADADARQLQRGRRATATTRTTRARDPRDATVSTAGRRSAPADRARASAPSANFWAGNVGTETSGSVLSPSNQNMLAGIKPTVGRISRYGVIPITADQDTPGPMARSVSDVAIMLGALESAAPDPERSGDAHLHAAAGPRLHEVPRTATV